MRLPQRTDTELVRAFVTDRDEAAFREVVLRYSPLVLNVALRTTHDRQAAEDVLQATFLVLVEKAASLDDPAQVAAWLHGVAQRISRRLVDKRHRHREQSHREESVIMDPGTATDPFERVCETRDHDVLGEELQRLPAKYRTPMVLRYLEELTNEQVAERLGMKITTVEGRLKRGKKELRRRLARRGVTLGAAMLVWSMTRQAAQATPISDLASSVAATALGWEQPATTAPPPSEPAVTLAQQELLTMSALKLTTVSTLIGAVLATGLLVAMTSADDAPGVAMPGSATDDERIETSLSTGVDGGSDPSTLSVDQRQALSTEEIEVFQLQHADAESAVRMLSQVFESDDKETGGVSDAAPPKLSFDARTNTVIAAGEQSQLDVVEAILLRLDLPDVVADAATPAADPFAPATPIDPNLLSPAEIPPSADDYKPENFRLLGSLRGRIFRLQHADAESVYKLLNGMISDDARQIAGVRSEGHIWLSFDARTNSIVAAGDKSKMETLEGMLAKLDAQMQPMAVSSASGAVESALQDASGKPPERLVVVYQLEYVNAAELHNTLGVIFPGAATEADSQLMSDAALRLAVDTRANRIIAHGTDQQIREVEVLIQELDRPAPRRPVEPEPTSVNAELRLQFDDDTPSRFDLTKRSPAEQRLRDILTHPTVPAFDEYSLDQVLFVLGEEHGFQYFIDRDALVDAGIVIDETSVSLNLQNAPELRDDVTVESALELALRQASQSAGGFGESALVSFVRQGLLIVTTRDVAQRTMEVRTYDLRPFSTEGTFLRIEAVIEAIRIMAGEMSWVEQGGRGSIIEGVDTMTVRQSPLVHGEIEKLLEHLLHAGEHTRAISKETD